MLSPLSGLKAKILACAMQLVFDGIPWDADLLLERCVAVGVEPHIVGKYSGAIITTLRCKKIIVSIGARPSKRNDGSLLVVWQARNSRTEAKEPAIMEAYGAKKSKVRR
jgi:hypothetical protein